MEPGIVVVALCIIVALTHKYWAKLWERREGGGESTAEPVPPSFALTESQGEWERVQRELDGLPPIEECDEILPPEPVGAEHEQEVEPIDSRPSKADVPFGRRPVRGWLKLFEVLQIIGVAVGALTLMFVLILLVGAVLQAAARGEGFPKIDFVGCILAVAGFVMQFLVVLWFKRREMRFRTMFSALIAVSFFSWCASALTEPPASMTSAISLMIHAAWIPYLNQSPQVQALFSPPPYRQR